MRRAFYSRLTNFRILTPLTDFLGGTDPPSQFFELHP